MRSERIAPTDRQLQEGWCATFCVYSVGAVLKRSLAALALIFLIPSIALSSDGVWTLTEGAGIAFRENRSINDTQTLGVVIITPSYRSDRWKFSLDINLRWNLEGQGFMSEEWKRKGDPLRALSELVYRADSGSWKAGIEVLRGITLGSGQLVRGIRGDAEYDYAVPGFTIMGNSGKADMELVLDRVVDPGLAALAVKYKPNSNTVFFLEGAVDQDAPVTFTGVFQSGRPRADISESIAGYLGQGRIRLLDRKVLDLWFSLTSGVLGSSSDGLGGSALLEFDFSQFYLHQLKIELGSMQCQNGYIPAYFDELYLLERWGLNGSTMRTLVPLGSGVPDRRMDSISIRYNVGEHFQMKTGYDRFDDETMRRAGMSISLMEEGRRGLQADIWSRADSRDQELFDSELNLFTRIGALYDFFPHTLVKISLQHSWALDETAGGVIPVTDVLFGAVYSISL